MTMAFLLDFFFWGGGALKKTILNASEFSRTSIAWFCALIILNKMFLFNG